MPVDVFLTALKSGRVQRNMVGGERVTACLIGNAHSWPKTFRWLHSRCSVSSSVSPSSGHSRCRLQRGAFLHCRPSGNSCFPPSCAQYQRRRSPIRVNPCVQPTRASKTSKVRPTISPIPLADLRQISSTAQHAAQPSSHTTFVQTATRRCGACGRNSRPIPRYKER